MKTLAFYAGWVGGVCLAECFVEFMEAGEDTGAETGHGGFDALEAFALAVASF